MQVTTLSTQLGFGLELVDCYRDATSVPFGHLLVDLSPRIDDRLRYCTNTGSIPSNFYIPDRLKQSKVYTMDTQNLSTLQVFQPFSHKYKSHFVQSCPKFYPVSSRMHNKSAQRKPAKHKKTSRGKISKQGSAIASKTNNLEAKKRFSGVR